MYCTIMKNLSKKKKIIIYSYNIYKIDTQRMYRISYLHINKHTIPFLNNNI